MVSSVADFPAYNLITPVIELFNDEIEKFYLNLYKVPVDADDPFRGLDLNCIRLSAFIAWVT